MKRLTCLLSFCLLTTGLLAAAPYPSVLTVKYKDQRLPVVHVKTTDPVIMVNGKEKSIWAEPDYQIQEAPRFADNFVAVEPGSLGGPFRVRFIGGDGARGTTLTYVDVPLTARKTIKRGFAVLIIYADPTKSKELQDKAFGGHVEIAGLGTNFFFGTTIIVHELPELPAGQPVKVKFTAGGALPLLLTDYFIQIFDDEGREVRTTDVAFAWEFYAKRDRARLAQGVAKYLEKFKGSDHDAVPAVMRKPIFPDGATMPAGEVDVTLTVEADGVVSAVEVPGVKDDGVRQSLTDALGGWLFLPRLKAGVPVATQVSFPLKF